MGELARGLGLWDSAAMSVRKEGDGHEVVVDLDDWADLADRKIKEAQAAGHFDNLPGLGRPLQLYENPLEGEWALAHRIMRNADISPPWIGLQQQVQRRSDALRAGLAQIGRQLHDRRQRLLTLPYSERALAAKRLRGDSATARTRYLRAAAALDRLLTAYNAALPRHLFWLQKPRLTPKRAAATFDKACPPLAGL